MGKICRFVFFSSFVFVLFFSSCISKSVVPNPPKAVPESKFQENPFLNLVKSLPLNASKESLEDVMPAILSALFLSPVADANRIEKGIELLREQPNIVKSLHPIYRNIPETDRHQRHFIISVLGELRRTESLELLQQVAWAPLPPPEESHYLTSREREESIQAKAAQGMAYLRTEVGDRAVIKVIEAHASKYVRASAIEAFLWNHGNSPDAVKLVKEKIQSDDMRYIDITRFQRSIRADTFNKNLKQWREKYQK